MANTTAQSALLAAFNSRLPLSGGEMTGALILIGDPSNDLEASTKQYVDNSVAGISWDSLTGKPDFATVATTGNYDDLINKPNLPATPNAYITQSWSSGANWYRVWSNGFIEQGGNRGASSSDADVSVSFFRNYTNSLSIGVYISFTSQINSSSEWESASNAFNRSTTSFTYRAKSTTGITWFACGF